MHMNVEVKKIFTSVPVVLFKCSHKISSYLVRSKLYPLARVERPTRYGKKRCKVYINISEMDTFTSTVTGETLKVNHKLNSDGHRCWRNYS